MNWRTGCNRKASFLQYTQLKGYYIMSKYKLVMLLEFVFVVWVSWDQFLRPILRCYVIMLKIGNKEHLDQLPRDPTPLFPEVESYHPSSKILHYACQKRMRMDGKMSGEHLVSGPGGPLSLVPTVLLKTGLRDLFPIFQSLLLFNFVPFFS